MEKERSFEVSHHGGINDQERATDAQQKDVIKYFYGN
jgi:hypothetical protein